MYRGTSEEFNNLIEQNGGRTFKIRLTAPSFSIETGIKKITYSAGSSSDEGISVGSAMSAYIEVTAEKIPHIVTGQSISFDLGLEVNGAIEYMPMGIFKVNKPEMTDYEITFKAYDRMTQAEKNYVSDLKYPTDTVKVMQEITQKLGIEFVTDISPITLNNPSTEEGSSNVVFAGYTIREAIGYIAGLYGKFAVFNREGKLEFRWYEDNGFEIPTSKCYSFTKNENNYTINKIIGTAGDNTQYEAGSGITGISFNNPFMTQEIVNKIHTDIGGFTYRGGETRILGDCRIDVWDIVTGTDLFGNTYKLPVMEIVHEIDGGLTTTVKSKVSDSENVEDSFKGPVVKAMERTHAQLLLVNNLIASKASIEYLEANYIKTDEIDAVEANIENAVITNLQGKFASIEYLEANYAEINFANVEKATIGTMLADVGLISSATIVDGHVTGFLDAVKVNASNITAGVLDAGNIEVVNLKAASITVGQINGYQIAPGAIDMNNLAESITNEISSASSNAQTALDEALKAFDEAEAAALIAGTAQATADGKNTVYYQSSAPAVAKKNDIWFNTSKDNQMSIYNGSKWVTEQFGAGAIANNTITSEQIATEVNTKINNAFTNSGVALSTASTASTNALNAINKSNEAIQEALLATTAAGTAQATADGKNTVFYQTTAPTGTHKINDVWFDTDDSNKMYYWNGSAWTAKQFGTNAIANASITNALIADATIQSAKIANLDAGKITSGYIDAARIKAGTITLGQLNTSVQNTINGAAQQIYHTTSAGSGTAGYFCLAQIKILEAYANQPIKIAVINRSGVPSSVWITFLNENNKDPGISRFAKTGTVSFYLAKSATSTWSLYASKAEPYDYLSVTGYEVGTLQKVRMNFTWQSTMVTALPSGYITAAQTIATAEWCYNNDITYINGGKLYTGTVVAAAIAASAITTDKLAANAVTAAKMAVGTITAASGIIANAAIQTANIADLAVTGAKLANATIGTAKIADAAITSAKIANLAVTNAKIADATIQSAKIANLDAGKITTGTLNADRIGANTITTIKIAVGDFINYASWKDKTAATSPFTKRNSPWSIDTTVYRTSKASYKFTGTAEANMTEIVIPVNIGEEIYAEFWYKTDSGWTCNTSNSKLRFGSSSGGLLTQFAVSATAQTSWTKVSGTYKVTNSTGPYISVSFNMSGTAAGKSIWIDDITIKKRTTGELIVDGAITTNKLSANAVTAGKIAANAVTAGTITSGAITTDKLAANAVTAAKLTVGNGGNLYATGYDTFENIPNIAARIYYMKHGSATVSIDTSTAYYGSRCLKINSASTDSYVYLGDSANGYGCIPVVTGKTYIVSAWMKASANTSVDLFVVGHKEKNATNSHHQNVTATIGTTWQRIYTRYTALSSYPYISVRVDNNTNGTTLWVDAIQIETGTQNQTPSEFSPAGTTVINGGRIITGTITANSIAASAITTDKLAANSITAAKIVSGAITSEKISAGAVTAAKISVTDLKALGAKIAGFEITDTYIRATDDTVGMGRTAEWAFWAGGGTTATAKFRVTNAGDVYMSSATITGGKLDLNASGNTADSANPSTAYIKTTYDKLNYVNIYANKVGGHAIFQASTYSTDIRGEGLTVKNGANTTIQLDAALGVVQCADIQVLKTIRNTGNIHVGGIITSNGGARSNAGFNVASSDAYHMGIYDGGNMLSVKTDVGAIALQTNGSGVHCTNYANSANVPIFASAFTVRSSKRYKIPQGSMTQDEANKLLKLDVVKFDYINGDKGQYGLYAEDTIPIIPECVVKDEHDRPDGIDYSKLVPFLIKKAQMQEQKINYLENMVTHLIGIAMNPSRVKTYQI